MRVMGGWIALTPELPAKLLLGRHVWDCAQHADQWGQRLARAARPAQVSEPSNRVRARSWTPSSGREAPGADGRAAGRRLPGPEAAPRRRVRRPPGAANPVYEPPTRRILERCLADERRHMPTASPC